MLRPYGKFPVLKPKLREQILEEVVLCPLEIRSFAYSKEEWTKYVMFLLLREFSEWEGFMSKEYRYKKSWKILVALVVAMVMGFSMCMIFIPPKGFWMVVFVVVLLLLAILLLIIMYIRRAGICISVEGNAVIYKDHRKEKKILFNTISHLKFNLFTDVGLKIVSENNTIQISTGLQNISDFLQELKNAINQKELSINYDRKKFFSFFKMAVSEDQSWARGDPIFWKSNVITILSAVIGAVCAISSRLSSFEVFMWILLSMFWPSVCYSYAEEIFRRRLLKQIDEQSLTYPPRDIAYEKALYRKVLIFGALIYIVISIVAALFSIIIKK